MIQKKPYRGHGKLYLVSSTSTRAGTSVKPRRPGRARLLSTLARQSLAVYVTGEWDQAPELRELLAILRLSPDRKRSITYRGIRFPLRHSLVSKSAICPRTGLPLVGVLDL